MLHLKIMRDHKDNFMASVLKFLEHYNPDYRVYYGDVAWLLHHCRDKALGKHLEVDNGDAIAKIRSKQIVPSLARLVLDHIKLADLYARADDVPKGFKRAVLEQIKTFESLQSTSTCQSKRQSSAKHKSFSRTSGSAK